MRRALAACLFLALLASAATARAEVVQYMSRHPLPKRVGHGFCDIDVPHFHDYPPSDPRLYRQVDGQYYFVGDPTPFDYDGPRYSFYGPHPITDSAVQLGGPAYCYLRGPHYHWYAPPPQAQFEMRGGAYWYVGAYDPAYYNDQPRFVVINDVYAPMVYARPMIDVQFAPASFHGEIFVGGGWRAGPGGPMYGGPGWRGGPPPGVERREMVMREHRAQEIQREQHRNWEQRQHERGHGPVAHGGPERGAWHAGPPTERGGHRGAPVTPPNSGWHGGPPRGGAPAANAWHGGGGGQRPAGHANGFHR